MPSSQKPVEDESTSWIWAGLWLLSVYVSIPLARTVQEFVRDRLSPHLFTWTTVGAVLVSGLILLRMARAGRLAIRTGQSAVLVLVGGVFCWLAWSLRANPEEAFHFVQYGVFGALVFRALQHRLSDSCIYLIAFGIGVAAGTVDELIQWVVPRRFFDFRDIALNASAGLLVQVAIAFGIRPRSIAPGFGKKGLRLFCALGVLNSLLFLFITVNTPRVWNMYKREIPRWGRIDEVLVEYGHRIEDPAIGSFNSRLTRDELMARDREQGPEVAGILNRHKPRNAFLMMMTRTPVWEKPLLVESRMHLHQRDQAVLDMKDGEKSLKEIRLAASRALLENRIMETYFPVTMAHAQYQWTPETRAWVESNADPAFRFHSGVARHLTTRVSGPVAVSIPVAMFLMFVATERLIAGARRIP